MFTEQEAYDALAPFIKDYIYDKHWKSLNLLQIATIEAVEEGEHNLLLTAGTSQGKTEAAFLPCISHIANVKKTVGILYISPLKALINDQFVRLEEMLAQSELSITKWHGDALTGRKEKLLEAPDGIVQMTPESLEAMLCRHPERVERLFSKLKYVIIDEIHYFINDQRGIQLLILLDRLQRICRCDPLRIGLSATIQNTDYALEYLNKGSRRQGKVIAVKAANQQAFCSVTATRIGKEEFPERYIRKLYRQTEGKRTLLFTNSRRFCETLINKLKTYALEHQQPDIYQIHHGSVSKQIREDTEVFMKNSNLPVCTGTTMTLELGIDIGSLDEVIQAADPMSISSMVQRLGRSGRRTGRSSISFQLMHREERGDKKKFDLQLVRSIAMIELYFREHYLESIQMPQNPYRLLLHTILSTICEKGCLPPRVLAYHVLELSVFDQVSLNDFRDALNAMLDKKILVLYEDGAIGLSDEGERIVNQMDFYAVFSGAETMTVYYMGAEIGTVERVYQPGDLFFLSGYTWVVLSSDRNAKRIDVEEADPDEETSIQYYGNGFLETDQRVMGKIHEILLSEDDYRYLDEGTKGILKAVREKSQKYQLLDEITKESGTGNLLLNPILSTTTIFTLFHVLRAHDVACERVYLRELLYGIRIKNMSEVAFKNLCKKLLGEKYLIDHAYVARSLKYNGRYFNMLPDNLKAKEIIGDILDVEGVRSYLTALVEGSSSDKCV